MTTPPVVPALPPARSAAEILDSVRGFICRFVAFPSKAALDSVALWAAHAHLVHVGENTPRLALLSPEPGSGKTRTLEVLELLVPRPMAVLNASAPPIFRSIGSENRPTLLFDEVDAIFGGRPGKDEPAQDLRALLNSGHRKGAKIPRCVGPRHDVEFFPTFAAVAMAGLGDLPDTLMSRSVIIRMRRRSPGEHVEPYRRRVHESAGTDLHDELVAWAQTVTDRVRGAWPEMPDGITDRPADVWEPLLAVADAAGGHWPETARDACVKLARVAENREASLGVKLLADLRTVFADSDALHTETILEALHKLDESPWADMRGKPLDPRGLARRLKQYEVGSVDVKLADVNRKGYRREHLWDTWTRYLPDPDPDPDPAPAPSPGSATCATSATDPDSERESSPGQVALGVTGSATSGTKRYLEDPNPERESQLGSPGSAGSAPVGTEAAAEPANPERVDDDPELPLPKQAVESPTTAEPNPYQRVCRDCPELIPKHHVTCRPCAHRAMYPSSARQGDAPMTPVERDQ